LVLAGVNSLLGNTVINGGVLEIAGNSKLYTKWQVATVKVNTGATLRVNSWGGYNESGGLDQTPADYPNALLLDGGTLEFTGAPGVRGNSDRAFALGAGGGSLKNSSSGNWTLSASGTNTQAMVMNNSSLTLAGTGLCGQFQKRIAGNGSLTKTDGGTWILSAKNNYTGPTVVSGGKLVLLGDNNRSTSVTVAAGAELDITGKLYATGNIINNGTIVLSGAEQFGAGGRITNNGTIINNSPSLTLPAIVNHGTISSGKTKSDGLEAIRPLSSP
jgi:autotransporter-associated beta strand protein